MSIMLILAFVQEVNRNVSGILLDGRSIKSDL